MINFELILSEAIKDTDIRAAVVPHIPVDTGRLRASFSHYPDFGGWSVENQAPYASFVEYGTVKMAPRNTVETALPAIAEAFDKALQKNIDRYA